MKFKFFTSFVVAAALLTFTGCEKGPNEDTENPGIKGQGITRFMASIETPKVSRAIISSSNTPTWKAGDNMLVLSYNGTAITNFKAMLDGSTANKSTSYFTPVSGRTLPKGQETYAVYPYFQPKLADVSGGSNGNRRFKLTLGEQTPSFNENFHLPLLVGVWDDASESFTMSNPLLVVRLKLSLPVGESDFTMRRIRIAGNNDETLWGTAATFSTSDMRLEFNEESAVKSISLDCNNETLSAAGKTISFCIPAAEYSKGLNVKVYCLEGVYNTDIRPEGINAANNTIIEESLVANITKSDIFVDIARATDTTIAIAWSKNKENVNYLSQLYPNPSAKYTEDITKDYKVAIYSDEECKQLVYSASVLKGESLFQESVCPPRFIFAGLAPQTDYYIHVHNITDGKQTPYPFKVTTAASVATSNTFAYTKPGDIILFENFGDFVYGGDIAARAAGVTRSDRGSLTSFSGVDLKGELNLNYEAVDGTTQAYVAAAASVEMGLFNTLKGLVDDMELTNWGWIGGKDGANGGSVCARPGYAKIGIGGSRSFIVTPMLSGIPAGTTAKVTVKFKAAPYGDVGKDINAAEKDIVVKVLNDTSINSSNKISFTSEGEKKAFTLDGERSCDWKEYSVTLNNVQSTSRIAIGGNRANTTDTNRFLLDDVAVYVESLDTAVVTGKITYDDGTPAADVVVSDGFSCVKTDANGNYSLKPHKETWYIFYSIPADCEVPINSYGQPAFFTKYSSTSKTYDFTLTRMPAKEDKFALFCFADVQCANTSQINRFKNESVPDIYAHAKSKGIPCYGVTLGDVAYSQGTRNCEALMPTLRNAMAKDIMGMPVFQTMGNHDYSYIFSETDPQPCTGYQDLEFQLKAQRSFEKVFGPINYSWNRGDTHIISMRNMLWYDGLAWDHYGDPRFLDAQYEWLKQDLAHVPTDKMVILCVHCSIENSTKSNVQNILNLLSKYKDAHIMSGHHHRNTNHPTKSTVNGKAIYEHNHGAVCGHFWKSNFNADGSPNGYGVYEIEGNKMTDWYYKGVNAGINDRRYQIRIYRGNLRCGGQYDHIQLQHGSNVILANVFNADDNWKVKIYEDGVYAGTMTRMAMSNAGPKQYSPDQNNPGKPSVSSSLDWWLIAYHTGVLGLGDPKDNTKHEGNYKDNYHMYKWTLKNPNARSIKVEATDIWGNVYTCDQITGDYDYSIM